MVIKFLASQSGRLLRGGLGVAVITLTHLFLSEQLLITILTGIGLLLLFGAIFDVCLLAGLYKKPISGAKLCHRPSYSTTSILLSVGALIVATSAIIYSPAYRPTAEAPRPKTTSVKTLQEDLLPAPATEQTAVEKNNQSQKEMLLYLIEEEKLAHDTYATLYDAFGANVFGNILKSETSHQSQVLTLLQAASISDPRSSERGVFIDQELQIFYNELVSKGKQNIQEAYKAGVAIEEKDIADISKQLETATDPSVISTLGRLRNASENHLRAFNRQLSRY
ncbi:MAG: DUF2202 domain-containing protein [Candidatus Saccharimonadales bacterium]